jgi:hypothetical protein
MSVPVSKIEADLTNWRRRAGWTAIFQRRCHNDRAAMAALIGRCMDGSERDPEVRKEVEKVISYLKREEEGRVGEWVHHVS